MSIQNLFKSLTSPFTRRPQARPRPPAWRPFFEPLEYRRTPSFGLATNYDTSYGPRSADVGDFNGDGRADVVSATSLGIAVRLNHGNGTLAPEVLYPLGQDPLTTAVGDLNGDGKLDLAATTTTMRYVGYFDQDGNYVVGYVTDGHVKVMLGNGDGTFTVAAASYDLGENSRYTEAVLGDLDADGDLDLAISNLDGAAYVLLGNGNGTFAAAQNPAVGVPTRDVDLADLNADGKLDLVAGSAFGNKVRVLLGNGNGIFQTAQTVASLTVEGQPVAGINQAVGDINGDGTLDLAVTYNAEYGFNDGGGDVSYAVGYATVLLGHGDGTFAVGDSYPIGPGHVERDLLADFTGDGKLDLVTGGSFTGNVALLVGSGDGTFNAPAFSPAGSVHGEPYDIAVADLDGDGTLDIATANAGSNTLSVLLNGVGPLPALSIGDVTITEGNTGTRAAIFTLTLSAASGQPVTVNYATANGTATAGGDYRATSGTLTIPAGQATATITVLVTGDRLPEPNETFFVKLSSPTNATIADGQGAGTLLDDEPRISISDVTKKEGKKGQTTQFTFTVTLSADYDQPVTMSFKNTDGNAKTSDGDYAAKTGTLTIAPGETTKTVTIAVNGDSKKEADEVFYLDLFGDSGNSLFTKSRGVGTILNDD